MLDDKYVRVLQRSPVVYQDVDLELLFIFRLCELHLCALQDCELGGPSQLIRMPKMTFGDSYG